jgi:hypothetical protein
MPELLWRAIAHPGRPERSLPGARHGHRLPGAASTREEGRFGVDRFNRELTQGREDGALPTYCRASSPRCPRSSGG